MITIENGSRAAVVCCSDGYSEKSRHRIRFLNDRLIKTGLIPVFSRYIFAKDSVFGASAEERAAELMDFFADDSIKAVFDISGGDIANEILPYLDYEVIGNSGKMLWGYSDLTTVLNAVYTKTGKTSVLYQIKNIINSDSEIQTRNFYSTVFCGGRELFDFGFEFIQGEHMEGVVVGGNTRCFLKLAGTEYFPDLSNKILLLEAFRGGRAKICTYFNQLYQMGAFKRVGGVLLGTFTEIAEKGDMDYVFSLARKLCGADVPIAYTDGIGHGADSKGIIIGEKITLGKE